MIAADIFPPVSGGPATYSVNIANELHDRGLLTGVVSLTKNSDKNKINGPLWSVSFNNKILRYLQYLWLLFVKSKQADVIFTMGPVNAGLPALIVSKFLGKKMVVKVVGDYAWEQGVVRFGVKDMIDSFQNKNDYGLAINFLKYIESLVVRHANGIVVPSQYLKEIVKGWGADDNKVKVIYNAVEFNNVEPFTNKKENEKRLVSVARLLPWKGMDVLIKVVADLVQVYPDLKLKIIGDGPEKERLTGLVDELGMSRVVELTGELPKSKTLSYIKSADIFILNSGYEGLSHVILEALSFNKPVLASRVGGNPEVVISGYGSLFEFNNGEQIKTAIKNILESIAKGENLVVMEQTKFLEQFKFEAMVDLTVDYLQTI